jgi:hypothetical protein
MAYSVTHIYTLRQQAKLGKFSVVSVQDNNFVLCATNGKCLLPSIAEQSHTVSTVTVQLHQILPLAHRNVQLPDDWRTGYNEYGKEYTYSCTKDTKLVSWVDPMKTIRNRCLITRCLYKDALSQKRYLSSRLQCL